MLVREILGRKEKKGDVGLELEVESLGVPLPLEVPKPWGAKPEGSLRGDPGCTVEYYTQGAVEVSDNKLEKITRLTNLLNDPRQKTVKDSPRTSFHVHCNVLNFTPKEVWAAATLYWLVEDAMMDYCGEDRKGNVFCLRLKDAEAVLAHAARDVFNPVPFVRLAHDQIRYSGLNLNSLAKFGTLEFRGMRGTTDPEILDNWSTAVSTLVNVGKELGSPSTILDLYLEGMDLYGLGVHEKIRSGKDYKTSMDEAALRLSEFAYLVDWDEWETRCIEHYKALTEAAKPRFRVEQDDAPMPQARPARNMFWQEPIDNFGD